MIAEFTSSFGILLLRATRVPGVIDFISPVKKKKHSPDWMLGKGTKNSHRELCELAREWGATQFDDMLRDAARGADPIRARELCILAREYLDAEGIKANLDQMSYESARKGNRDVCILARDWARERNDAEYVSSVTNSMLCGAAYGTDPVRARDLCILAKEWLDAGDVNSGTDYNRMLCNAAWSGHRDLCILAREWIDAARGTSGAPDFNTMLQSATYSADSVCCRDICILAKEWADAEGTGDALDFDGMFYKVASHGHYDLCILAREWAHGWLNAEGVPSISIFENALGGAACGGHRNICELIYGWAHEAQLKLRDISGTQRTPPISFDDMIWGAARCADPIHARELCELAREWAQIEFARERESGTCASPINFNYMLCGAAREGHRDICILAREWIMSEPSSAKANFSEMIYCAAFSGHCDICELARKWNDEMGIKTDLNEVLRHANMCSDFTRGPDVRELAHKWIDRAEGTQDIQGALRAPTSRPMQNP